MENILDGSQDAVVFVLPADKLRHRPDGHDVQRLRGQHDHQPLCRQPLYALNEPGHVVVVVVVSAAIDLFVLALFLGPELVKLFLDSLRDSQPGQSGQQAGVHSGEAVSFSDDAHVPEACRNRI